MLASDVPILETLSFVQKYAPPPPARILEVGCGSGRLASHLRDSGYQIIALDTSVDAVVKAQSHGLDARVARWPDFDESPFDLVLFTRSLHHIRELPKAIEQAKHILRPNGMVLVEEFASEEVENVTVQWLYELLTLLNGLLPLQWASGWLGRDFLEHTNPMAAWKAAHHERIHPSVEMEACLRANFPHVDVHVAPYLFRYICAVLGDTTTSGNTALHVLESERRFAAVGGVRLIGRRYVATL